MEKKKKETKPRHRHKWNGKPFTIGSNEINLSDTRSVTIDSGFRSRILYRHEQKLLEFFIVLYEMQREIGACSCSIALFGLIRFVRSILEHVLL